MPKTNDKSDVSAEVLRSINSRIAKCVARFEAIATEMDSKQIASLPLALDTFKKVVLDRLEGFTRTVERELNRADDAKVTRLSRIPGR